MDIQAEGNSCLLLRVDKGGKAKRNGRVAGWQVVIAAWTVSNKTKGSQYKTQQCSCSSRPQDISQTIQFLYAFHLEGVRIRVRLTVELESMLKMLVVAKLMVPACS